MTHLHTFAPRAVWIPAIVDLDYSALAPADKAELAHWLKTNNVTPGHIVDYTDPYVGIFEGVVDSISYIDIYN